MSILKKIGVLVFIYFLFNFNEKSIEEISFEVLIF
jgi:hypothetical protein